MSWVGIPKHGMLVLMNKLTSAQTEELRAALRARMEQLLGELDVVKEDNAERIAGAGNVPQDAYATQANREAQNAVRDAEARRDHDELVAVRKALQRITDGTYGECVDCGQPVGLARLLAFPAALRCIDCQAQAEKAAR